MIADDGGMTCFAISDCLSGSSKKVAGHRPHPGYDLGKVRFSKKGRFA